MKVDRHVELFGARVNRPVFFQIKEFAIAHAVQHGALKAVLGHATLELIGRGCRIGGGKRREGGKALAVGGADFG